MKVMDGIKQAVLAQNWDMICKIYTFVTKEPLSPPKPKTEAETISTIELPDNFINNNILPNIIVDIPTPSTNAPKKIGRPKKKEPNLSGKGHLSRTEPINTQNRQTLFFGEGSSEDSHRNNPELQKLYGNMTHTKSSRQIEYLDVICSVCGKEENVPPILAHGYNDSPEENSYKCNSCCSRGS